MRITESKHMLGLENFPRGLGLDSAFKGFVGVISSFRATFRRHRESKTFETGGLWRANVEQKGLGRIL
jgi:hypothetical protein